LACHEKARPGSRKYTLATPVVGRVLSLTEDDGGEGRPVRARRGRSPADAKHVLPEVVGSLQPRVAAS